MEWKRTETQYVAILQVLERFESGSIRELERRGPEIVLGGTLRGTARTDWYALAYRRHDLEFEEAKTLARQAMERYREQQAGAGR